MEIDEGDFIPDYSESVLIHRRDIEELNKEIKVWHLQSMNVVGHYILCHLCLQTHGEGKLASMNECKDFKRGIRMLEWYRFPHN